MGRDDAVAAFWAWWPTVSDRLAAAVEEGEPLTVGEEISERVRALGDGLNWELGPGSHAPTAFSLTAQGNPVARARAEEWLAAAPVLEDWEFRATRAAVADPEGLVLGLPDGSLSFSELRFGLEVDETRERVHLSVFHPILEELPDEVLHQVIFLALDASLGEDGVERWVGDLDLADEEPPEAVGLDGLRATVDELRERATGNSWAVLQGTVDGAPLVITANLAIKRWDHPRFSCHGAVRIPLLHVQENGLPTSEETRKLTQLEEGLLSALGDRVVFVGRESHQGMVTLHLYARPEGPVPEAVRRWAASTDRSVEVVWTDDPGWRVYSRW